MTNTHLDPSARQVEGYNHETCSLPIFEPMRKPDVYERKSKTHSSRKDECKVTYRRNRKQKAGNVQSGCRLRPESEVSFRVNNHYQAQDITEPAFSRPNG